MTSHGPENQLLRKKCNMQMVYAGDILFFGLSKIWSILLIKSDLNWCIHFSTRPFLNLNYLVIVIAGGPKSRRGHM